jgi:NitT/TauT family transport system ATP-binding protein
METVQTQPDLDAKTKDSPANRPGKPAQEVVARFDSVNLTFASKTSSRRVHALGEVTFDIAANEFIAVVGPSGCGKSTLLNLLAGLMEPTGGSISLRGTEVKGLQKSIGYVTQDSNLLPWLTVEENMRMPLKIRNWPKAKQDEEIARWLEIVGLTGFEKAYPRQLSGGMQKRCSIARTLVYDPDILLMDEPFGAVDAITRSLLQDTLLRIWTERPKTVLFITHDLSEALALADKVVIMTKRPGTVKAVVPVRVPRPRDVFHLSEDPEFGKQQRELWDLFTSEI